MTETRIAAELAGRLIFVSEVGRSVSAGEDVATVEAMKMEIPVASPVSGKVTAVLAQIDNMVEEGQLLLIIET